MTPIRSVFQFVVIKVLIDIGLVWSEGWILILLLQDAYLVLRLALEVTLFI